MPQITNNLKIINPQSQFALQEFEEVVVSRVGTFIERQGRKKRSEKKRKVVEVICWFDFGQVERTCGKDSEQMTRAAQLAAAKD